MTQATDKNHKTETPVSISPPNAGIDLIDATEYAPHHQRKQYIKVPAY